MVYLEVGRENIGSEVRFIVIFVIEVLSELPMYGTKVAGSCAALLLRVVAN